MVRQQANSMVTDLLLPLPPAPPPIDFMFDSSHTSPLNTAPSSPQNFTSFHPNDQYVEQEEIDIDDFAFDFSGQLVPSISDADELFESGKLKPLDPLPPQTKPKSPKFAQAFHRSRKDKNFIETFHRDQTKPKHKPSRSLSPIRGSNVKTNVQITTTNQTSSLFGFTWHNKWNLKNLLLFRSTSAGSAEITKEAKNCSNNTSFRSVDGSVSGSSRRKMKRKVSAHEIHYTANRAVSEERRRKTMLPYKSGFLGCLGCGITMHHEVSNRGIRL